MFCMVCEDRSKGSAMLRALATEVYRNSGGVPLRVEVLYVDSGRSDVVALDRIYPINAAAAAEPRRAVECAIRNLKPTVASTPFDLGQLEKRGTLLYEAVFYTTSDTGIYAVDLYAMCQEKKVGTRTYDIREYLIAEGFAEPIHHSDTLDSAQAAVPAHLVPSAVPSTAGEPEDELPAGTKPLQIMVTFTCSPAHFYGQEISARRQLALVQRVLPLCTERVDSATKIKTGNAFILKESPQQNGARVRVEAVLESGMCRVFLIDYGNRRTVTTSSLYKSHPRLHHIPPLATRFQLSDVQPRKGGWTEAALDRFAALVDSETLLAAVPVSTGSSRNAFDDQVQVVKLFSRKHGNLAKCMTQEGHAQSTKSCLVPVPNPTWPYDPRAEYKSPPTSVNMHNPRLEAPSMAAPCVGAMWKGCTQAFSRQEGLSSYSHVYRGPAGFPACEPVIDPVRPLRPPEVGSQVLGQVSAILSPSCFYLIFPYGRRSVDRLATQGRGLNLRDTLETLMMELQDSYSRGADRESRHVAKAQGELVAAQSKLDERWYRARVASLEEGGVLCVFYMDFGFCESLSVTRVRCLEERFTRLPQQALQACLVTTSSAQGELVGDEPSWDSESCESFVNCVRGQDLLVEIVGVAQGLLHVRLFFHEDGRIYNVAKCVTGAVQEDD
ncbi:tudor domain-containing protein 1-like [Haemaphysalis longicornis]